VKWFQVDSNTPNDPKMRAIQGRHGVEGIGATFLLWCFVANHGARAGWSIDHREQPIARPFLVDASGLDEARFEALVATLIEVGHVSAHEWRDRGVLAFPAMERRADIYTKRGQSFAKSADSRRGSKRVRTDVEQSSKSVRQQTVQTNKQTNKQDSTNYVVVSTKDKYSAQRARGQKKAVEKSKPYRVILKLAHGVIDRTPKPDRSFAGLKSDLKHACAKSHIPYDADVVGRALESALATNGTQKARGGGR